ncbi:MAG: tetratricopeptide repeat protein, partial [Candidatus Odinarchaeota archaeon]
MGSMSSLVLFSLIALVDFSLFLLIRRKERIVAKILHIFEGELQIQYSDISPVEKWLLERENDSFRRGIINFFTIHPYVFPFLIVVSGFVALVLISIIFILNQDYQINMLQIIVAGAFLFYSLFSSEIFSMFNFVNYLDFVTESATKLSTLTFPDYEKITRIEELMMLREKQFLLLVCINLLFSLIFDEVMEFISTLVFSIILLPVFQFLNHQRNEGWLIFIIVFIAVIAASLFLTIIMRGFSFIFTRKTFSKTPKSWFLLQKRVSLKTWKRDTADQIENYWKGELEKSRYSDNKYKHRFCLGILASLYLETGEYEQAHNCLTKLEQLSREIGDKKGLATALSSLGEYYLATGEYSRSIECFEESYKLHSNELLLVSIALAYIDSGDLSKGEWYITTHVPEKYKISILKAYWTYVTGRYHHASDNLGLANEEYFKAFKLATKLGLNTLAARICLQRAEVSLKKYLAYWDEQEIDEHV